MTQRYNCHYFSSSVELTSVTRHLNIQGTLFVFLHPFLLYFHLMPLCKHTNCHGLVIFAHKN